MDELLRFSGVGRKIANLLLGDIYKKPAIVADTHCIRICGRFGMYPEDLKDAHKVERIMSGLVSPEKQSDFCHRIVQFGRDVCIARSPKCAECPLGDICEKYNVNEFWLRTGEGEMFRQKSRAQEIADFAASLYENPTSFQAKLVTVLAKLDYDQWKLLEAKAQELFDEMQKEKADQ